MRSSDFQISVELPRLDRGLAIASTTGGLTIQGWALAVRGLAGIDINVDGAHVAAAQTGFRRDDVAAAFPNAANALHSGFAAFVPPEALGRGRRRIAVILRDLQGFALRHEFEVQAEPTPIGDGPWALRAKISHSETGLKLRAIGEGPPPFTIRLAGPVEAWLRDGDASFESLRRQAYPHWSIDSRMPAELRARVARSGLARRISPMPRAAGGFVLLLHAGDLLGCDALLEFALASRLHPTADFLYADERRTSPASGALEPFFKPDWSPDLLLSMNYVGRSWCARRELAERAGVLGTPAGDYDAVLRLTERAKSIHHVARVLSERAPRGDRPADEQRALRDAAARRGIKGKVVAGLARGSHRLQRALTGDGLVSIIISTCGAKGLVKTCIESLKARTRNPRFEIICIENIPPDGAQLKSWLRENVDRLIAYEGRFNWSRANNLAARAASGDHLLFLNDDVEVIDPGWLGALMEHGQRPEVGAVGAQLRYADGKVQHAGIALSDVPGRGLHLFRHSPADDPGYFGLALTQRNVIGVTGACLLTRRATFERLGGFDESHDVVNNDLDYCLRAWRSGLVNVFTPHARLVHHEMASRGDLGDAFDSAAFDRSWRDLFLGGDPYLNPWLSRYQESVTVEREPLGIVHSANPLFDRSSIARILVVKLDHIGDCVTALPAFRRLRALFPEAKISVLAAANTRGLWEAQPGVEEVLAFDLFHARSGAGRRRVDDKALLDLQTQLRSRHFDLAIDLRKSPDTRHVLRYTGARWLAGFDRDARHSWLDVALEWEGDVGRAAKHHHVTDDLINLVEALRVRCTEEALPPVTGKPTRVRLPKKLFLRPVVCVHPGAGADTRQWPAGRFADLINLVAARHQVHFALIGSTDERPIAASVLERIREPGKVFDLVGKLPLEELPRLLSSCALFVGNNSGPKHLAAQLGIPTVAIHSGVVDAVEWGAHGRNALTVQRRMVCSPCYITRASECPRAMACLETLSAGDVLPRIELLLLLGNA